LQTNVCEWCQDWLEDYKKSPVDDPAGAARGSDRVICGGGFALPAGGCRSAFRFWVEPERRGRFLGLRVSLVPADK